MAEKVNIVIPTIGESVSEGTIGRWFHNEGDLVRKDEPLFEVDSDKATLEVPAAASGRLSILIPAGKSASVGSLVGVIEQVAGEASSKPKSENGQTKEAPKVAAPKPIIASAPTP